MAYDRTFYDCEAFVGISLLCFSESIVDHWLVDGPTREYARLHHHDFHDSHCEVSDHFF